MNLPSTEEFRITEHTIAGAPVVHVVPNFIGCKWDLSNLQFRSSVWDGEKCISAGFKKFFNLGEKPDLYPPLPEDLKGVSCVEKIDGSCLIVSRYRDQVIARTRGTVDARRMENGHEIDYLQKKYPMAFDVPFGYTYLYEWTTPTNRIVLDYGDEPQLFLVGAIENSTYRLETQEKLDELARILGVRRPRRYTFSSLQNMVETVAAFEEAEGVCAYYNDDQNIVKIKGVRYLTLHAFKSQCTLDNLLDIYMTLRSSLNFVPSLDGFFEYIERNFDYECAVQARPLMYSIVASAGLLEAEICFLRDVIERFQGSPKKDFALYVLEHHKPVSAIAFHLWDKPGKPVADKILRKAIYEQANPR
jgi:hypothetical protein